MRCNLIVRAALAALLAFTLGLAACDDDELTYQEDNAISLQAFVPKGESEKEPALEGRWIAEAEATGNEEQEPDGFIQITARKDDGYDLSYYEYKKTEQEGVEEELKAVYLCRAIRLGKYLFLDIKSNWQPQTGFWAPVHGIIRVELEGDELTLASITQTWLAQQIEEKRVKLPYERVQDKTILLTANKEELREFIEDASWIDEAFDRGPKFHRQPVEEHPATAGGGASEGR